METLNVDMMAEARNAQWSADTFLGPGSIKAVAPAKVNLFLAVGERRADGYHEVVNVMHSLALHDVLYFHRSSEPWHIAESREELPNHMAVIGPSDNILVSVTTADKTQVVMRSLDISASENLVVKALDALARAIEHTDSERVSVHIEKNVPYQAGLGGGSSDAAAALAAAARMWDIPDDDPVLQRVAASLGADVAFFLQGGCALLEGIGERIGAHLTPAKYPVVLVKPSVGVSTAQAYARFDEDPISVPSTLLAQVQSAEFASDVSLYNNLAPAAEALVPELARIREWLSAEAKEASEHLSTQVTRVASAASTASAASATSAASAAPAASTTPDGQVLLCGSGSCTFAIVDSFAQASRIAARASAQGWWSRATTLSSLRAAIL